MIPWPKVILGLLGVTVVVILIAVPTAIFLNDEGGSKMRSFTLSDVFNNSLVPNFYDMEWISDHEYLHNNGSVDLHNVLTNTSVEFLSAETFIRVDSYEYKLSADRKYVAFLSNISKEWKDITYTVSCHIYDMEKQDFLTTPDVPHEIQHVQWAPEGNQLAFVWEYNVYIKTSPATPAEQVTFNGEYNQIFNGIPDWVYGEEMLSDGLFWSPGGKYLAYAEFNDTQVHAIEYSWYGEDQYPETVLLPYPKAGTPNPTVKLFVVETANTTNISEVVIPSEFGSGDHYLCTVTWVTDERMAVQWMKRKQTEILVQFYKLSGNNWNADESLKLTSHTGWIGRHRPLAPVFSTDKSSYYVVTSDTDGYKHIHHVVGGKMKAITTGPWEVEEILKVTADSVYFSSNQEGGRPGGRNVYRWYNGRGSKCLTCGFEICLYNSAKFSQDASFYAAGCLGPAIPRFYLYDNRGGEVVEMRVMEHNKEFGSRISEIHMPTMRHGTIQIGDLKLWYQMTLPPGFEESKKYPLLVDVYGGPASQTVDFKYHTRDWSSYLASTEKIIVAKFDGRGSGYQGDHIMHAIYKRLGTYEVEDQITAVREFIKMGFIDEDRIAMWGWSYGGYVTSMVLGSGSGLFKCGIAVAPVANWEYYDSIYTERYMEQPSENPNYKNSTVTALAKNFHNVKYLLVHGTADDNVHFQQSAQISKALVEEQVDFEAMWYTDMAHDLDGGNKHLHTHMSHFLLQCFA